MRSMFYKNLSTSGKPFFNERTNESINGILNLVQGRPHIDFSNDTDIKSSDWIVNSAGEHLFITDISPVSVYKSCYYITEYEFNQSYKQSTSFQINAQNIENSIIGNQTNATINLNSQLEEMRNMVNQLSSSDKNELLEIISLLEEIKNSNEPVKKGFLYKFSSVMERNSWITGSIAGFLLNLFLGQ